MNAGRRPPVGRGGHVNLVLGSAKESPEDGCAAMRQDGIGAARQDGGEVAPAGRERSVADRVHTAVQLVQVTFRDAMCNRVTAETGGKQLVAGDDAVLRAGQRGDGAIRRLNVRRVARRAARVAPRRSRRPAVRRPMHGSTYRTLSRHTRQPTAHTAGRHPSGGRRHTLGTPSPVTAAVRPYTRP